MCACQLGRRTQPVNTDEPQQMTKITGRGVIAAGHEQTAAVGADALRRGGNAVDAAVAANFAAFSCEPVLTSPYGGGFATVAGLNEAG